MDSTAASPPSALNEPLPVLAAEPGLDRCRRCTAVIGSLAMVLLAYLIGVYACALNRTFYLHHAPFFDSCAYDNLLANVITTTRHHGIIKAIPISMSTNYLPWLEAAVLTKLFPHAMTVTRTTGVWLQISWALPMLLSLFLYFHVLRRMDAILSFAATLPFIAWPVLWSANGGFSDFRMDLALYLFFATTAVWFLATFETKKWYPWILMGIAAGLTALMRATSPVYLVVSLGPPLLVRIIFSPERKRIMLQAVAAGVIAALVSGWFFVLNFKYLKYYYVDWNRDSKTGMTLKEASEHYNFIKSDLGFHHIFDPGPILWFCIAMGVVTLLTVTPRALGLRLRDPLKLLREINWSALYIGYAPVTMLVLQRAGLNPFVSMPACFGMLMFPLALDIRPLPSRRPKWIGMIFAGVGVALLFNIALRGIDVHAADPNMGTNPLEATMSGYHQVVDEILTDASAHGKSHVIFAGTQLLGLHGIGFGNVLTFDYAFTPLDNMYIRGGTQVQFDSVYQPAVPVEWRDVPGGDEAGQIKELALRANASVDYIAVPIESSMKFAEDEPILCRNYANLTCRPLCKAILAGGNWEPIGDPVSLSHVEKVTIYANRHGDHAEPTTRP